MCQICIGLLLCDRMKSEIDFKASVFFVLLFYSHSPALYCGAQTISSFIEKCSITDATFSSTKVSLYFSTVHPESVKDKL